MSPTLSVLYSELVLSLYPILIKVVNTNMYTQLLSRFLVFPILAFLGATLYHQPLWDSTSDWLSALIMNIINMAHIGVSYTAFKDLPAGTAISLFYLYPIFNVIAGVLLFGESISLLSIGLILVAFVGTYFIATSHPEEKKTDTAYHTTYDRGVIMGILAAMTETLIFIFVRSNKKAHQSPFYAISQLYPFGLVALIGYGLFQTNMVDTTPIHWLYLLGFNAILGFTGYLARFYGISNVPTIVFSLLSFIGVIGGYVWGLLFTDDKPTVKAVIGGGCIAGSIAMLRYFDT
jgi:drug/metabolite transporter (DMT)-like permease